LEEKKIDLSSRLYTVFIEELKNEIIFVPVIRLFFTMVDLLKIFNLSVLALKFITLFFIGSF
jgi:hypothetical protein